VAHRGRLNADEALAAALAAGQTMRDAATFAGVSTRTATRRLAEAGFRKRVAELRAEMIQGALGRLNDAMLAAADTLKVLLTATSENVRLGAARAVFELSCRVKETTEWEARLSALEARSHE
jgi:hypothetical protein